MLSQPTTGIQRHAMPDRAISLGGAPTRQLPEVTRQCPKDWRTSTLVGLWLSVVLASCASPKPTNKVLLVIREGSSPPLEFMLTREVAVMKQLLENEGFEVAVATPKGEAFSSKTIQPNVKLADVNIDMYRGVILPCMGVSPTHSVPEAIEIVRRALERGRPVAAQYSAVIELARAGALNGKRYAYTTRPPLYEEGFRDGTYAGRDVVQDGNIITSGVCPYMAKRDGVADNTAKLTRTFIAVLKQTAR
jgi:putative intracellular protease/amidase